MAEDELSFEGAAEGAQETQAPTLAFEPDQDVQELPGFVPDNALSFEEAAGEQPDGTQGTFADYDVEQKYKSPITKTLDVLSIPEEAVAGQVIKVAPQIKDAATDIANALGIDTSEWKPVDQEKWKTYLKSKEIHMHDITNLLIDKGHAKSRFVAGLAADIFSDPTLYVGNVFGTTSKGLQALKKGEEATRLADRLRKGESAVARIGLGKFSKNTPQAVNRIAADALDLAEEVGTKVLDQADQVTGGQTRRALYNFLTETNDPRVRSAIKEYDAMNVGDSFNTQVLNDKLRPTLEGLTNEQKAKLRDYIEQPFEIKNLGEIRSDIAWKKFPLDPSLREFADTMSRELRHRNEELAKFIGAVDETGRPTIGWSSIKEAISEDDILKRPTSYFPRQTAPEYKQFLKENDLSGDLVEAIDAPIYTDASRRQRTYDNLLATEAEGVERTRVNSLLKEQGKDVQYGGRIYEDDPLNALVRYNWQAKNHLNKMRLERKLTETSIPADEYAKLAPSEKVKWQKFNAHPDVVDSKNPFAVGKQLHGRYMKQGDADRARMALNFHADDLLNKATYGAAFATRFLRQAALLSPRYFMGNVTGNAMNQFVVAPNRAQLFSDNAKAFGIIRDFAKRGNKVFNVAGELKPANEIIEEAARLGLWDSSRAAEFYENVNHVPDILNATIDASKNVYSKTGKLPSPMNMFRFNQEFTALYADNLAKLGLYMNFRNAGYAKEAAAKATQAALFNFADVSPALSYGRRVAPFITFPIKMLPFTAKTIAKYPFLPGLVDRTVKNAVSQNFDLDPMEVNVVQSLAPVYYRTVFDPLIANVLPGNNLLLSDLQSPMSTANNILNMRAPGLQQVALMMAGVNPETFERIQIQDWDESLNRDPGVIQSLGKALVTDVIPKPIKGLLSLVPGSEGFINNPYAAQVSQRFSKYRTIVDNSDQELGKYMTTQSFMRKFMPDAFERIVVEQDPEFFRKVGSVTRQHLKDVFFGYTQAVPLDAEMFLRMQAIKREKKNLQNDQKTIAAARFTSMANDYKEADWKENEEKINKLTKTLGNLGLQYEMINKLQREQGRVIKSDKPPLDLQEQ